MALGVAPLNRGIMTAYEDSGGVFRSVLSVKPSDCTLSRVFLSVSFFSVLCDAKDSVAFLRRGYLMFGIFVHKVMRASCLAFQS